MKSNEEMMRDRKAARLASAWTAAGGDSATMRFYVDGASDGLQAAQTVLHTLLVAASELAGRPHVWNDASSATWELVVRKLRLQEMVI